MTQLPTPNSSPSGDRTGTPADSSTIGTAAVGPPQFPITLLNPSTRSGKLTKRPARLFRRVRTAFRAFPILTTPSNVCRRLHMPLSGGGETAVAAGHISGSKRVTGTLYGRRKARITLAIQDSPCSLPVLLLELTVPTAKFTTDMGSSGSIRVALECEKKGDQKGGRVRLLNEPVWTAFVNGKNAGYGTRREPTEGDLQIMQMLHATSVGAGVLPGPTTDPVDSELMYMRAHFDRVVGSKDSETFYMSSPDGNAGPELSVFFVRI